MPTAANELILHSGVPHSEFKQHDIFVRIPAPMKQLLLAFALLYATSGFTQCWQKVSSRYDHVIAIHNDGTLWNWGGAIGYQRSLTTPTLLDTNIWSEIATGNSFQAAIKSDGTLWTWGYNSYGQLGLGTTTNVWTPTQVGVDTDWSKVACGRDHMIALKTDGTLWIWGRNNYGQLGTGTDRTNSSTPTQLGVDTDWAEISGGEWHTLARKTNQSLYFVGACYGTQVSALHMVGTSGIWKTMGAGAYSDYGIRTNGTLWTWGQNNGNYTNLTQVGVANTWEKVSTSHETHSLFINTAGELWAIGYNTFGQLGDGTLNYTSTPVLVDNSNNWSEVIAGNHYSLALKSNQSFWGWGRNHHAQFGNGYNKNVLQPVLQTGPWKMATSSTGSYNSHTLAIKEDGTLWAWGPNNDGQLGDYTTTSHPLPNQVGTDTTWLTVSNGFHFSLGIKEDGSLWAWGRNSRGQLGLGSGIGTKKNPTHVGTDTTWWKVSCGAEFSLALKTDSTLWAWGYNFSGQIGNGSSGSSATVYTPIQIGTDSNWVDIATGYEHSIALRADSTMWSWGDDGYGQLGRSGNYLFPAQVDTNEWLEIACGGLHTLAIQADSSLWAFGRNLYGQLGTGGTANSSTPIAIAPGKKWLDIEGGYEHSVGIDDQDSLWAWGRGAMGQLGDSLTYTYGSSSYPPLRPKTNDTYKGLGAGAVNSIAIKTDGTLQTCGDSYVVDYNMNFPQLGYLTMTPTQWNSCNYCPPTSYSYNDTICFGDSLLFGGSYRDATGTYMETLVNSNGCDSLLYLNLYLRSELLGADTLTVCDSMTWIDGITYYASTTAPTFILNGVTGCDSTVSLNLTVLHSTSSTYVQTACDSYTWALDGSTYTSSGMYTATLTNTVGCDSVVTLDLTINVPTSATDVVTACNSYTWIDGITYISSNDTATHTLTNAAGCDSVVTLDLTIQTTNTNVVVDDPILTASATGVSYQWVDCNNGFAPISGAVNASYQAAANGSYAVVIDDGMCVDTSTCASIVTVGLETLTLDPDLYVYPNPSFDGLFKIELDGKIVRIELLDLMGRVQQILVHPTSTIVDGSALATGVYIVRVTDEKGRVYNASVQIKL